MLQSRKKVYLAQLYSVLTFRLKMDENVDRDLTVSFRRQLELAGAQISMWW